MSEKNKNTRNRRRAIKTLGGVGGGVVLARSWQRPQVDSVIVPSHAQLSDFSGNAVFGSGVVDVVADSGNPLLDMLIPAAYAPTVIPLAFNICVTVNNFLATVDVHLCNDDSATHTQTNVNVAVPFASLPVPFASGNDVFGSIAISGQIQPSNGTFVLPGTLHHAGGNDDFTGTIGGGCAPVECCFLAGTSVWMADGSYKAIEDVALGDLVTSHDFATGKHIVSPVTRLHRAAAPGYLQVNDLRVTGAHPFAVGDEQWRPAAELQPGAVVYGSEGLFPITKTETIHQATNVFNLRVEGTHNYFVGSKDRMYLVHNKA